MHTYMHAHTFIGSQCPVRKTETTILCTSNSGNLTQGIGHPGGKRAEGHTGESEATQNFVQLYITCFFFFLSEGNSTPEG